MLVNCCCTSHAQSFIFAYTKSVQQWVVPSGVNTIISKMWGGGGGGGTSPEEPDVSSGGSGGYTEAIISTVPGQILYIAVGGGGIPPLYQIPEYPASDGAYSDSWPNGGKLIQMGGAGGGRSQISIFNTPQSDLNAAIRVASNIAVIAAGGGGGSSGRLPRSRTAGRAGGGLIGNNGTIGANSPGTQTTGGTCSTCGPGGFLQGGHSSSPWTGGGGDGYYGGSAGAMYQISSSDYMMGGGAGGSSYINFQYCSGTTYAGTDDGGYPYNANDTYNLMRYGKGGRRYTGGYVNCGVTTMDSVCRGQHGLVVISIPCAAGTFKNATGQCVSCLQGLYSTVESTFCSYCPSGKYSPDRVNCFLCPTGTFCVNSTANNPQNCSPGTYSNINGSTSCNDCPVGRTTNNVVGFSACLVKAHSPCSYVQFIVYKSIYFLFKDS